jgi:hypothetical protein
MYREMTFQHRNDIVRERERACFAFGIEKCLVFIQESLPSDIYGWYTLEYDVTLRRQVGHVL